MAIPYGACSTPSENPVVPLRLEPMLLISETESLPELLIQTFEPESIATPRPHPYLGRHNPYEMLEPPFPLPCRGGCIGNPLGLYS